MSALRQSVVAVLDEAARLPALLPHTPTREQIERLETELLKAPQVDLQTTHVLSGGVYARSILIPAGTVLTGAIHRKDHVNVVQGDITVTTDEGMKRLVGQHVLPTKAGMKRAGYAHADTVWTTVIRTDETELDRIEADITDEAERLQTRNPLIGIAPLQLPES